MKIIDQNIPSELFLLYSGSLQPAAPVLLAMTDNTTYFVKKRDPFRLPKMQGGGRL